MFVGSRMAFLGLPLGAAYAGVQARRGRLRRLAAGRIWHARLGHLRLPGDGAAPIHDATAAAGLSLEGVSKEEPLEEVVRTRGGARLRVAPPRAAIWR